MPPDNTPAYASVAFLRITAFDRRSVSEQAALKEKLEAHVRECIAHVPPADRAVLDADDGIALALFGEPARALDLGQALQETPAGLDLQLGLNHGPLAASAGGPDARVFGDGLGAAAAASRFAAPGQLLVTQDFANALEARDAGRRVSLVPAGDFTDTRVRLHSLFAYDAAKEARRRRRLLAFAAGGFVAIVALGGVARFVVPWLFPPPPALVTLAIKPRGEVLLDGVPRGHTPPLTELEVKPGRHVLVVRHPGFTPLQLTLDLKPGERMTVTHAFNAPRTEPKRDFWHELRRKFGGR